MERPDTPAMDQIEVTIANLRAMEDEYRRKFDLLRKLIDEEIENLGREIPDSEARRKAAQYLYWFIPEAKAQTIAQALGGDSFGRLQHQGYFGTLPGHLACEKCGRALHFGSRSALHGAIQTEEAVRRKPGEHLWFKRLSFLTCERCNQQRHLEQKREQQERWNAAERERQARIQAVKGMTYVDYRRSPLWAERRREFEEERRFIEQYGCDICASENIPLTVYHRTLERLGDERMSDLCAACENCAPVLLSAGIVLPLG